MSNALDSITLHGQVSETAGFMSSMRVEQAVIGEPECFTFIAVQEAGEVAALLLTREDTVRLRDHLTHLLQTINHDGVTAEECEAYMRQSSDGVLGCANPKEHQS